MALRSPLPPFAGFPRSVDRDQYAWLERELKRASVIPLPVRALDDLFRVIEDVQLRTGETLYTKDDPPPGIWIIRAGAVELFDWNGKNRCVVSVLRCGDLVGDLHLLLGAEPPFTARALEPTSTWFVRGDTFTRIVTAHPALAFAWSSFCARRLARTRTRIFEILVRDPLQRVACLLVEESVGSHIRLPQKTLAQMLGMSRTSVNRALKVLERRGVVALSYSAVQIRDRDSLAAIAAGALEAAS